MSCGCNSHQYPYSCCGNSVQFRQDTAAQWVLHNPTLKCGEPGYETDTGAWKLGNGTSTWTQLAYQPAVGPQGPAGAAGPQGVPGVPNSLRIGLVTTGAVASASITGTPPNQVLNLVLPTSGGGTSTGVFFSVQPNNVNGSVGQSVTFTAQAQSTETPITYLWQKSYDGSVWTSAGSTSTILTYTIASMSDNGLMVRCKATVPSGASAFSLVATVTIGSSGSDPLIGPPNFEPYPAVLAPLLQNPTASASPPSLYAGMPGLRFKDVIAQTGSALTGAYKTQFKTSGGAWTDCTNTRAWWVQVNTSPTDVFPPYFTEPTRPTNQAGQSWGAIRTGVLIYGTPINQPLVFRVAAIGSNGVGAWSIASNSVTPTNAGG